MKHEQPLWPFIPTFALGVIFFVILFGLSGCEALNPAGKITADYNPTTGVIHYESNKDVNIELVRDGDKTSLKIHSDAAAGIKARSEASQAHTGTVNSLIKLIK